MRRATAFLVLLAPLLRAQSTPVTLPLTAVDPRVIIGAISGPAGNFTTAAGSVTFTIGAATGTLSVQAPSSITGLDNGESFQLSSPMVFTLSHTLTGFSIVRATLYAPGSVAGVCQVTDFRNTDTCSVKAISRGDLIVNGTNLGSGAVLSAIINLQVGNSIVEYGVNFQWSTETAAVCPATSSAISAINGPRDDTSPTCPTNSITLDTALPSSSDPLLAFAQYLPAFCGFGTYTYRGANQAHIFLELLDQQGNVLARSGIKPGNKPTDPGTAFGKTIDFPPGSKLGWGGGCTDAKQLIFIAEQFIMPRIDYPPGTPLDKVVASFNLRASLYDSVTSQQLATSKPVVFNVAPGVSATSQLLLRTGDDPRSEIIVDLTVPIEPSRRLVLKGIPQFENGKLIVAVRNAAARFGNRLLLRVSLDLASSAGMLDAEIIILDGQGKRLEGGAKVEPRPVSKGHNQVDLNLLGLLDPGSAQVVIVPRITLESGNQIPFTPTLLTVDSISIVAITPDPKKCDLKTSPQDCPVANQVNSFKTRLAIRPATGGETYAWEFVTARTLLEYDIDGPYPFAPDPKPTPETLNVYDHIVSGEKIENPTFVVVSYKRNPPFSTEDAVLYRDFTTLAAQIAGSVSNQVYNFADGKLNGILSAANAKIASLKRAGQALSTVDQIDSAAKFGVPPHVDRFKITASARAATANPPVLSINSTWQFDPPIPHDGSFSASISLNYNAAVLPDDPNFDESKLQVVSSDSSGNLRVYPTTLDMTNKVATAQIDGLDPYYSLAVIGPFTQTPVMFASASTGYALVNTGSQDSNVSVTSYSTDGAGTPATSILKAANRMQSGGSDWLQAWSNQSTVTGVSWFDNGSQFAVTPAQAPGQIFVFTDVEYDARKSTEIDLANTSPFDARVAIDLFGSDGSLRGTYSTTIAPKDTFAARVESMFPAVTAGFSGYAMVRSRETLAASGYQWTNTIVTGLAAQSIRVPSLAATTAWYAPQLGGLGLVATLHLVNTAATTANVTLKAWGANGSPAAANVTIQLAAGQQYTSVIPDIFGVNPSTAGSIEVDSDTGGIFGDVLTVDSNFFPKYLISLPLSGQPVASSVLPYAGPKTTVYVFNPNSSTANVTVTPYGADGAKGSASSATVPAFGRGTITVNANAYATVGSSQPVVASGWIDVPSRPTTGYLTLPSSGAPTGPGSTSVPTIAVTPASFDFANVTVGQSKTQKFTIGNTGQADLHVQTVTLTGGPGFSLPAFAATTIAAGKSVDVSVTFQPASAASVSASLTISSDDPNQASLAVKLTGTGIALPAPAIKVTATSLDFGTVNVNSTKDLTLAIANGGNAALNVSAAFSPNPPFSVATPAASFAVSAGSTQTVTVRFAPTVSGAQSGTLTLTSNDAANPSLTLKFTGTGAAAPTSADVVLKVDGGEFDAVVGYPSGAATAYFLNRLTPPSYPATIKSVQIFFSTRDDGLKLNTPLTIISEANATIGAATLTLSGAVTDLVPGTVSALDKFVTYTVPSRTITSGDFVVGFMVPNAPGIYPADQDQLTPSRARSYTSNNGATFALLDSISSDVAGNLGIRAVVTTGGTAASTCVTPPSNLVSWWRGDGNAADSTGGNNGTLQGAATFAAGEVGPAFNFDGNTGYVSIGNPANLRLTSAITIEGWINPRAVPSGTNLASIVTKWAQKFDATSDSDSYGLWLQPNGGGLALFSAIHLSGTSEANLRAGSIPLNTWTHVAMTFDGSTAQYNLYVNGQTVASQTAAGAITATSRNVLIGREDSIAPRPFNGLIDEVAIYSRALTDSEIQAIFKAGSAGKCTSTSGR